MTYEKLRNTIQQNNLSWDEIDTIFLNSNNLQHMQETASFDVSDKITSTNGQERIVCQSDTGVGVTIEL
jgi:hypothetical protein